MNLDTIILPNVLGSWSVSLRSGWDLNCLHIAKNGTTYTWRILPLGGYVSMAGLEDDTEELKKGMPVSLITDENGVVQKINTSKKLTLVRRDPARID